MYEGGDRTPGSPRLRLEHQIRTILYREFVTAVERAKQATESFRCRHAGHSARNTRRGIHSASREVSVARIQMS